MIIADLIWLCDLINDNYTDNQLSVNFCKILELKCTKKAICDHAKLKCKNIFINLIFIQHVTIYFEPSLNIRCHTIFTNEPNQQSLIMSP